MSDTFVDVPVQNLDLITGRAVIIDALTRMPIGLTKPRLYLLGEVLCVRGQMLHSVGPRCRVRFDDGRTAWVRPILEAEDNKVPA